LIFTEDRSQAWRRELVLSWLVKSTDASIC